MTAHEAVQDYAAAYMRNRLAAKVWRKCIERYGAKASITRKAHTLTVKDTYLELHNARMAINAEWFRNLRNEV